MQIEKTQQGKVVLYDCATGDRVERWPVDARGMVNAGTHQYAPPSEPRPTQGADGQRFDPIITPTMDVVGGDPSGKFDAQLGAATAVTTDIPPAGVQQLGEQLKETGPLKQVEPAPAPLPAAEVVTPSMASAVAPPWGNELPKTTPLGQPAVHSTAAQASEGKTDQAPVRIAKGKEK